MGDPFVEDLLERLAPLGELRARRMFGGVGLYCDDVFFGLIAAGLLYFKADEETVPSYEAAGMQPFRPFEDRAGTMAYWEVPSEVLERTPRLVEWAREALAAARRRDASKRKRTRRRTAVADPGATSVRRLTNLGPKSAAWLEAVGVRTRADLERVGSVGAFRAVAQAGLSTSLNLLYALEGALLELRWDRLPEVVKQNLRERAGRSSPRGRPR